MNLSGRYRKWEGNKLRRGILEYSGFACGGRE
jgi:hypothetical protein